MTLQLVRAARFAVPLCLVPALSLGQGLPSRTIAERTLPLPPQHADVKTTAVLAPPEQAPERTAPAAAAALPAPRSLARPTANQPAMQVDHSRVYVHADASGTVWARGADYKMRFDANGAAFVPFFGSHAPRSFDLNLRLVAASAGSTELALDAGASPTLDQTVVTFDRGEIDEVFELSPGSAEHKFVLSSLPASGDVHVRVAFDSELLGSADADGWRFTNEYGYVHYGQATAIDAKGRSLALRGELQGNAIDFVVPADFAARAAFPLVIDPVIATYPLESGPVHSLSPDLTYDWSGGYAMHVWEEVFNAGDHDVYSVIYDVYGNVISSTGGYLDYTSANWVRPRCAYMQALDRYAFTAEVGSVGNRAIWGFVREPYWSFSSGPFLLSDPSTAARRSTPTSATTRTSDRRTSASCTSAL